LVIGPESIKGTLAGSPKRAFATVRVNDPDLVKELDERKISYSGRYENRFLSSLLSWVLPLGIFS
jgi:cell division protease FtsH